MKKNSIFIFVIFFVLLIFMNSCVKQQDKQIISEKRDYYNYKIPEDWKIYKYKSLIENKLIHSQLPELIHSQFSYPPSLGKVEVPQVFINTTNPFTPLIIQTDKDMALASGGLFNPLGPVYGLVGRYRGNDLRQSAIEYISKLNFDNFCDELRIGPLNHAQYLNLPKEVKDKLIAEEKENNDLKIIYGYGQNVINCNLDKDNKLIEFIIVNKKPDKWTPNANIVDERSVGVIKFTPNFAFMIAVPVNIVIINYTASLPEPEIQKTIYLMAKSFKILE